MAKSREGQGTGPVSGKGTGDRLVIMEERNDYDFSTGTEFTRLRINGHEFSIRFSVGFDLYRGNDFLGIYPDIESAKDTAIEYVRQLESMKDFLEQDDDIPI